VILDNGLQFVSEEFATFLKKNGVKHICCAPYHPYLNGAVERFIQTFKQSMRASENDGRSLSYRLAIELLHMPLPTEVLLLFSSIEHSVFDSPYSILILSCFG
jgi:transposase InsO family protein